MDHVALVARLASPRAAFDRWRAWRITRLLPGLMVEHFERPPLEVLDCADAVVGYYEERGGRAPSLGLARRRTRECLRAGVCDGSGPALGRPEGNVRVFIGTQITGTPLRRYGNLIPRLGR